MNIPLDEVIYFDAITSTPSTGAAVDADSAPTFEVFEEATDTDIGVGGSMTKRTSKTGNYRGTFTVSAANGFEVGKWYNVIGSATIGAVVGKSLLKNFRIVAAEAIAGKPKSDTDALAGQTVSAAAGVTFPSSVASQTNITAGTITTVGTTTNLTNLPTIPADWLTAAGTAADFSTEVRTAINGGNWALSTDSSGRIRIVDGTGTGELDTLSGTVLLRSATQATIDNIAIDTTDILAQMLSSFNLDLIAGAVWMDATAGHFATVGSIGKSLFTSAAPGAAGGHFIAGSNAATSITTALTANIIGNITGNLSGSIGSYTGNTAQTGDSFAVVNSGTFGNSALKTLIDAIKVKSDLIPAVPASTTNITTVATVTNLTNLPTIPANWLTAAGTATDFGTEMRTVLHGGDWAADMDANGRHRIVDGTGTGEIDTTSGGVAVTAASIRTALGLASANLDTQLDALPTAIENADAFLDRTSGIETGITPRQCMRATAAILAGIVSGAQSASEVFKGIGHASGGTTRVTVVADDDGNRTAVTLNL